MPSANALMWRPSTRGLGWCGWCPCIAMPAFAFPSGVSVKSLCHRLEVKCSSRSSAGTQSLGCQDDVDCQGDTVTLHANSANSNYDNLRQVTSQHDIINWCSSRYREGLASSLGASSGRFFERWWGGWATPRSEVKFQIRRSSSHCSCTSCTSKSIHSSSKSSCTTCTSTTSLCSTSRSTKFSMVYATSKHNSTSKHKSTTCQRSSTRLGTKLPMGSRSQWSTPKVWCASIPTTATRGNQCMFSGKGCFRADAHRRRLERPDTLTHWLCFRSISLFCGHVFAWVCQVRSLRYSMWV